MSTDNDNLEPLDPEMGAELFLEQKATDCTDSTVQNHRYRLKHFLAWCDEEGIDNMNDLSGRDLQRYRLWLADGEEVSPVTMKNMMSGFRVFLKWAGSVEAVPENLYTKLMIPRVRRSQQSSEDRFVEGYDVRPDDWDKYSEQGRPTWLRYHVDSVAGVPQTTYGEEAECADWCDSSISTKSASAVVEYLRHGLPDHETHQTRKTVHPRVPWYRVERGDTAPILIALMTRSKVRVLLNETDARHLNSYYGIYPESTVGRTEQKALLAYLNSGFVDSIVSRHQRTLAGGVDKLEPGDVKELPVIDPRTLSEEVVDTLAECFDDLRKAARRGADGAAIIDQIDTVPQREL